MQSTKRQLFRPTTSRLVILPRANKTQPWCLIYQGYSNTRPIPLMKTLRLPLQDSHRSLPRGRRFSVLQRPTPNYPGHVPLNTWERIGLAACSSAMSLIDPGRADLIAAVGETTATPYFIRRLRDAMLSDPVGRRILRERPRITSQTLSPKKLRSLPPNSVGRAYVEWLDREGVDSDTRATVRYIDDEESAYVMQRYRECHDFYHAVTGLPIFFEGEVALKAFEFANTLLPMTGLSIFAAFRLRRLERQRFWDTYLPWALSNGLASKEIINVYWEEQLDRDVVDLRRQLGIARPPDLRAIRQGLREQRRKKNKTKSEQQSLVSS